MGENPHELHPFRFEIIPDFFGLLGKQAEPSHAGVDLEVQKRGFPSPAGRFLHFRKHPKITKGDVEPCPDGGSEFSAHRWNHQEDRVGKAGCP